MNLFIPRIQHLLCGTSETLHPCSGHQQLVVWFKDPRGALFFNLNTNRLLVLGKQSTDPPQSDAPAPRAAEHLRRRCRRRPQECPLHLRLAALAPGDGRPNPAV